MDHHNPTAISAAVAHIQAVRDGLGTPPNSREDLARANRALLSAYSHAQDVGIEDEELAVLTAAAGHPFSPQWAKDFA